VETQIFLINKIMAKTKLEKKKIIDDLADLIKKQKSMVIVGYKNIKSDILFEIKNAFKEKNNKLLIVKKTLFQKALKNYRIHNLANFLENLKDQIAVAFSFDDELDGVKISADFAKKIEPFQIYGGYLENRLFTKEEILQLASLPSKKELQGQFVYTIKSPVSSFVGVLQGNLRKLLIVLNQIKDKKS
jgi:large subunit ribosomal protein L10